jgi:hypothetical protein
MNAYDKIWQIYVYTVVDGGYKQTNIIIAVARPCNQSDWHPQDLLGILSVNRQVSSDPGWGICSAKVSSHP